MRLKMIIFVLAIIGVITDVEGSQFPPANSSSSCDLKNCIMQENEIWKDVVGYEGLYQVSDLGQVKSLRRDIMRTNGKTKPINERIMKPSKRAGYYLVVLSKFGQHSFYVHRLVSIMFIENRYNKPFVNHKNGVKTDNNVSNLEWVTPAENMKHAFDTGLMKRPKAWLGKKGKNNPSSKPVCQYSLDGIYIKTFDSAREALFATGIKSHISCVCLGKRNQAGGFIWKFKD